MRGPTVAFLIVILWAGLAIQAAASQDRLDKPFKTGEELYRAACATCHGIDGKGADRSRVGFDTPLPDFTDCSFATREPNEDWLAVTHDGGPARAFSRHMPALGAALTFEELERIMDHMRRFCSNKAWPRGELNLPRPLATEKAFPEDEAVLTTTISAEGRSAVSNKFVYEQRLGARNQFEIIVPFGWNELTPPASGQGIAASWVGGLGDVAVGAKRALFHSLEKGSIFSVAGEIVLPTGDSEKQMGKGTTVFEPFVSFGQILPSAFFPHAQAGLELPFDTGRAAREGFWRAALGRTWTQGQFGRAWSPMVELLAAREFDDDEKVNWDVLPQVQWTLSTRQHIMMNVGVRLPLTESGTRDTQVLVYLLWDWFDGGFFEGW